MTEVALWISAGRPDTLTNDGNTYGCLHVKIEREVGRIMGGIDKGDYECICPDEH